MSLGTDENVSAAYEQALEVSFRWHVSIFMKFLRPQQGKMLQKLQLIAYKTPYTDSNFEILIFKGLAWLFDDERALPLRVHLSVCGLGPYDSPSWCETSFLLRRCSIDTFYAICNVLSVLWMDGFSASTASRNVVSAPLEEALQGHLRSAFFPSALCSLTRAYERFHGLSGDWTRMWCEESLPRLVDANCRDRPRHDDAVCSVDSPCNEVTISL